MPDPTDKTGSPVQLGDTVEINYGGDAHIGPVKAIEEEFGVLILHVQTVAKVPVALARKLPNTIKASVTARRRSGS